MGGCRWRFWATLGVLALLGMCGGPSLIVAQYLSHTPKVYSSASVFYAVLPFLWIGLPVMGVCAFLGYRNSPYWHKRRRHKGLQVARASNREMRDGLAVAQMRQAGQPATANSVVPARGLATKLETARVLIEEKNYEVARAILKTMEHPQAAEWLEQIDRVSS